MKLTFRKSGIVAVGVLAGALMLPSTAMATDFGILRLARIRVIWPTSPAVLTFSASSMRRAATRTR